jgi:SAM-dependent methyltransferase
MNKAGRQLLRKYGEGRHWEGRGTEYTQRFCNFLRERGGWRNTLDLFGRVNLVDIGCGNGKDLIYFRNEGMVNAEGLDCNRTFIKKLRSLGLNARTGNIEKMPYDGGIFDAVYCTNVIHYADERKALLEIHRILKPFGYVFLNFNLKITDQSGEDEKIDYQKKPEQIFRNISNAGLDVVEGRIFRRMDIKPTHHEHKILELILEKDAGKKGR